MAWLARPTIRWSPHPRQSIIPLALFRAKTRMELLILSQHNIHTSKCNHQRESTWLRRVQKEQIFERMVANNKEIMNEHKNPYMRLYIWHHLHKLRINNLNSNINGPSGTNHELPYQNQPTTPQHQKYRLELLRTNNQDLYNCQSSNLCCVHPSSIEKCSITNLLSYWDVC